MRVNKRSKQIALMFSVLALGVGIYGFLGGFDPIKSNTLQWYYLRKIKVNPDYIHAVSKKSVNKEMQVAAMNYLNTNVHIIEKYKNIISGEFPNLRNTTLHNLKELKIIQTGGPLDEVCDYVSVIYFGNSLTRGILMEDDSLKIIKPRRAGSITPKIPKPPPPWIQELRKTVKSGSKIKIRSVEYNIWWVSLEYLIYTTKEQLPIYQIKRHYGNE